jgi:hypothetical protein
MITKLTEKALELEIDFTEIDFNFNQKKGWSITSYSNKLEIKELQKYLKELKNEL